MVVHTGEKGSKSCMWRMVSDSSATTWFARQTGANGLKWKYPIRVNGEIKENCLSRDLQKELWPDLRVDFSWWPPRGKKPQWDAIGTTEDGFVVLVEAKAHPSEVESGSCKAIPISRAKIEESMRLVQQEHYPLCVDFDNIWMCKYYQAANRLTFFEKLSEQPVKIKLVFLSFYNDDTHKNTTLVDFRNHNNNAFESIMGTTKFPDNIYSLYFDATKLQNECF